MKKFFAAILAGIFAIGSFALGEAREVTVEGVGVDRQSAINDARRVAVGEVIGTFVDSRTLTKNSMLEVDEICLKTRGFVGNVNVLSESVSEGIYKVRASIDVNQNPDDKFLQQIQAVVALNDPSIAVAIFRANTAVREERIESAIKDKLIDANFTHINVGEKTSADYLVRGRCFTKSQEIKIPDFKGGYIDTGIHSGATEMVVEIVKVDSGDVLETFTVEASGVEAGNDRAELEAVKNLAESTGAKVEEKFRKIGARV